MNNIATKLSAHERPSVIDSLQKGSQKDNIRRVTQVSHITHQKIRKDGPKNKKIKQLSNPRKTWRQNVVGYKKNKQKKKTATMCHFEHHQLWCRAASGRNSSCVCISMKDERLHNTRQCAHMQAVAYTRGTWVPFNKECCCPKAQ